jgi:hypothetical protein
VVLNTKGRGTGDGNNVWKFNLQSLEPLGHVQPRHCCRVLKVQDTTKTQHNTVVMSKTCVLRYSLYQSEHSIN